jgi:hypothetical protein
VEIDPECVLDDDYSALCVVVARVKPDGIAEDQWIGNPGQGPQGCILGSSFTVFVLWVWP